MIGRLVYIHESKGWPQYSGKVGEVLKEYPDDGDLLVNLGNHNRISIAKTEVRLVSRGGAS